MSEPGPPPTLLRHACVPGRVPPGGGVVGERERLRAALAWSYEFDLFVYETWSAFNCSVLFRTPESSGPVPQTQFEVTEDSLGIERTVLLRRTAGGVSMERVELTPLDSDFRGELAFKLLEASPEQRCIRYPGNPESSLYRPWRVRVGGLDAVRNPAALAEVRAGSYPPARFPEPLAARVEVADEFRVERLSPASNGRGEAQDHLAALFTLIREGVEPDSVMFGAGCDYAYRLDGSGMEVTTPVFLMPPESRDSRGLAEGMADMMRGWHGATRPPGGEFVIRLQVYRRETEGALSPQADFSRLLMAAESVAGL